jgi:hypothetical protein
MITDQPCCYEWGRTLVQLHDEQGLPLDISMEMSLECGEIRPAWLGICVEAAKRGWSIERVLSFAAQYDYLFHFSDAERQAVECMKRKAA